MHTFRNSLKSTILRLVPKRLVFSFIHKYVQTEVGFQEVKTYFDQTGFHLFRKSYYLPIPEPDAIDDKDELPMYGVDPRDDHQLQVARDVYMPYQEEFQSTFKIHAEGTSTSDGFFLVNGAYMAVDAHIYYAFIRHYRPKRIVEIGSGLSTRLAAQACLKTQETTGEKPELVAIEPYPAPYLKAGFPGLDRVIESKVQDVDLEFFTSLESGDILFIDSSHVFAEGNDVHYEYFHILPQIAPGVLVHIHDINLPYPYLNVYRKMDLFWNEQYILHALLMDNPNYEVEWWGSYMMAKYEQEMLEIFPEIEAMREQYPQAVPSSFWMRRVEK